MTGGRDQFSLLSPFVFVAALNQVLFVHRGQVDMSTCLLCRSTLETSGPDIELYSSSIQCLIVGNVFSSVLFVCCLKQQSVI